MSLCSGYPCAGNPHAFGRHSDPQFNAVLHAVVRAFHSTGEGTELLQHTILMSKAVLYYFKDVGKGEAIRYLVFPSC